MTNEEAIKHGKDQLEIFGGEHRAFISIAIQALEKQMQIERDIENFSDGYHTFNQLYHQRAILFAAIVNQNKDISWKTHYHEDGEPCFGGGWFLVTIDTPKGAYGYHYEDKYWDLFNCIELPMAKHWDGYTEDDVERLLPISWPHENGGDSHD